MILFILQHIHRIILLVILASSSCLGQNNDTEQMKIITDFSNAVIDGATNDHLIKEYLLLSDSSAQMLEYVAIQLTGLRMKLKSVSKSELTYKSYDQVVNKDLILSQETGRNTFVVYKNEKELFPILIEGSKIRAFSTMNKGGKKVFLLL